MPTELAPVADPDDGHGRFPSQGRPLISLPVHKNTAKLVPMFQVLTNHAKEPLSKIKGPTWLTDQSGYPLLMIAVMGLCLGCGQGGKRCSLKGTVRFAGELLPDGDIRLDPIQNPKAARASAHIENGQFEIPRKAGMLAGSYRVSAWAVRPTGRKVVSHETLHGQKIERVAEEEQYIPEHYNRRSQLHITLEPGENTKELNLGP